MTQAVETLTPGQTITLYGVEFTKDQAVAMLALRDRAKTGELEMLEYLTPDDVRRCKFARWLRTQGKLDEFGIPDTAEAPASPATPATPDTPL